MFVRTKWKRHTTAEGRREQLQSHVCDENDCPGALRMSIESSGLCRRCHVLTDVGDKTVGMGSTLLSRYCIAKMSRHLNPV